MIANGKYTKDGQEKTNWVKVGVIGTSQNGKEYVLLDPTVNLAGFEREVGKDMLMASIFEDQPRQQAQQGGYGQQQVPMQQQQYQPQNMQQAPQVVQQNVQSDGLPF